MTAWTRNAVSVAEPSVCNQFVSPGTFRKRKYLHAADEAGALLEPVERKWTGATACCVLVGLRARHQYRGGWSGYSHPSGPSTCSPG